MAKAPRRGQGLACLDACMHHVAYPARTGSGGSEKHYCDEELFHWKDSEDGKSTNASESPFFVHATNGRETLKHYVYGERRGILSGVCRGAVSSRSPCGCGWDSGLHNRSI